MISHVLSDDTQVSLLLCGRFGRDENDAFKPFAPIEHHRFVKWMGLQRRRIGSLLTREGLTWLKESGLKDLSRLLALLERGASLALAVESWQNRGLWIIGQSDDSYPRRFLEELNESAPPILYGAGNPELLSKGGLAVVGSREADDRTLEYAMNLGRTAARQGIALISGGARGVDLESMKSALAEGGNCVGVLADSLAKSALSAHYREALMQDRLALASPYNPNAPFSTANAMGRNKLIYSLANWAVVVSASYQKGGTWAGAVEALKRRKPVFARLDEETPEGNLMLSERGAIVMPHEPWDELSLKLDAASRTLTLDALSESETSETLPLEKLPEAFDSPFEEDRETTPATLNLENASRYDSDSSVYRVVLPLLMNHLQKPCSIVSLADSLKIRQAQLQDWLDQAIQEGKVIKKSRPTRYIASERSLFR